eukprot:CAMPEP_0196589302 /NCGR_PEP_ID=MMETSP1081-20130531/63245_1 /TAXON_ID=36882 /ORGANISM="Pyramimonas amylifera, Strain CCMP720" /LENGTH=424 /DNA_ID=CAMNT_0041912065 /DNA_START=217 /DNA_END=1491 /DNA_ORIENTATION=-
MIGFDECLSIPSKKFSTQACSDLTAAVVGAGISGLSCAHTLASKGFKVTVFESGRGVGGRMSTRRDKAPDGTPLQFDHGAQFFTASSPIFQKLVNIWTDEGVVAEWEGRFVKVDVETGFLSEDSVSYSRHVGVPGMNSICKYLAATEGLKIRSSTKVVGLRRVIHEDLPETSRRSSNELRSSLEVNEDERVWEVDVEASVDGVKQRMCGGQFDVVVVADKSFAALQSSSGKGISCMESVGVGAFGDAMKSAGKTPVFALMLAFENYLDLPFDALSVLSNPNIKYMSRNSSKPYREDEIDQWVVLSSVEFATKKIGNSMTQVGSGEHADLLEDVANELYAEFVEVVNKHFGCAEVKPLLKKAHRWGAAFPENDVGGGAKFFFSEPKRFLACGDFCRKPKYYPHGFVEVAVLSGVASAEKAASFFS